MCPGVQDGQTAEALAAVKAARIGVAAAVPASIGQAGGSGGSSGGGGGGGGLPGYEVCLLPSNFGESTIQEAVTYIEEGPPGVSPLFKWEEAGAQSARDRAWGANTGKQSQHHTQLKKLINFLAVYSLLKLRVHWHGDCVLDEKVGSVADLNNKASGVFVSTSKFKDNKGAAFLSGRILPESISDAFSSGGYSAAALATKSHIEAWVDENCGR